MHFLHALACIIILFPSSSWRCFQMSDDDHHASFHHDDIKRVKKEESVCLSEQHHLHLLIIVLILIISHIYNTWFGVSIFLFLEGLSSPCSCSHLFLFQNRKPQRSRKSARSSMHYSKDACVHIHFFLWYWRWLKDVSNGGGGAVIVKVIVKKET